MGISIEFKLTHEIRPEEINNFIKNILLDKESIEIGYEGINCSLVITDRRIILFTNTSKRNFTTSFPYEVIRSHATINGSNEYKPRIKSCLSFLIGTVSYKFELRNNSDAINLEKAISRILYKNPFWE